MKNGSVIDAEVWHAHRLAQNLRDDDRRELEVLEGKEPLDVILDCMQQSLVSWTWMIDGQVGAMAGIRPANIVGDEVDVWVLTSSAVDSHPIAFARCSRKVLNNILATHHRPCFLMDSRYAVALKWAEWLGFKREGSTEIGGVLFFLFSLPGRSLWGS